MCYELFVAAAVWLATLWACGYLPAPGQLLQHARLDSNRDLLFTCLESNRDLLFTCLDSNRALLFTGIGADAHDGAGYRGHRPLQQLQLGLRTCHVGRSCGAWLGAGGHRNAGFLGHLAPKHPAVTRDAQSGCSEGGR
jgi:hypothetical protein